MNIREYCSKLIEKHENRIASKGEASMTPPRKQLYALMRDIAHVNGNRISKENVIKKYKNRYHVGENSVPLPSDFCYNKVNIGPDFESKFLVSPERGKFEFVGFFWNSDKQINITWSPRGKDVPSEINGQTYTVGIYHNGSYCWNFEELKRLF